MRNKLQDSDAVLAEKPPISEAMAQMNAPTTDRPTEAEASLLVGWILVCTLGQFIPAALAWVSLMQRIKSPDVLVVPGGPLPYELAKGLNYMLSGGLYGAILGSAQWLVLRRRVPRARSWIIATMIGFGLGGGIFGPIYDVVYRGTADVYISFILSGAVIGAEVGLIQRLVLQEHFSGTSRWVLVNSALGAVIGFEAILCLLILPLLLVILPIVGLVSGITSGTLTSEVLEAFFAEQPAAAIGKMQK